MDFGPDISTYAAARTGLFADTFMPLHNGHLAMIDEAAAQVDVLFVCVLTNEAFEAALCQNSKFTPVSPRLRERWLSELFAARPNIRVLAAEAAPAALALLNPGEAESPRVPSSPQVLPSPQLARDFRTLASRCHHIDTVFCQTPAHASSLAQITPDTPHITLTPTPENSEEIRRAGMFASWESLPEPVQRHYTKRVAFCGWESSGKSYTAEHVAKALGTTCVPEYGREYYERLNSYEDIGESQDALNTMAGQLHSLERARGNKVLCLDTDLIYTQFYHLKDFGWMNPALDALIRANAERIDEWVFLEPRNPLADDGSRFRYDDDERQHTSNALQDLYREYGCNLHVVDEADDATRLAVCEQLVRSFMEPAVAEVSVR
ncbi:MAG: AAA family ATPase [Ancrocorticia sp.]|uniref:AAA family ATPase n=3 Tax=Ancrocorticia sp. TaxID=2593684 RepID=UPI003F923BCD